MTRTFLEPTKLFAATVAISCYYRRQICYIHQCRAATYNDCGFFLLQQSSNFATTGEGFCYIHHSGAATGNGGEMNCGNRRWIFLPPARDFATSIMV